MPEPRVNVDVLIVRNDQILLGLLSKEWLYEGKQVYGVPGRDIMFGETIGDSAARYVQEDLKCSITSHKVMCVNANKAFENHYIGIGVLVTLGSEPDLSPSKDWEKWEWFDTNALPTNLFPAAKNLLECYVEGKFCVLE
jgi:ADP-ribose pyrophosphatase YjhB (NUDIX family)